MGATVSLNEFTIDQIDTGKRPDSDHSQICKAINKCSSICLFYQHI